MHKRCKQYVYNMQIMCIFAADEEQTKTLIYKIMQADYYQIKLERFNQGLTQKQLAEKAKISLRTLANAERGRDISPTTNKAIKDALGIK